MELLTAWFIAGILLSAFSASLFTKARIEEQYGRYALVTADWLFQPSANAAMLATVFAAGAGMASFAWWYPLLLLATMVLVAVPGGQIYRSGLEFLYTPGRLGERVRHYFAWDDRAVLRQATRLLGRLRHKSARKSIVANDAYRRASEAIVAKANVLVNDRLPNYLELRRILREGITDVRYALPHGRQALPPPREGDIAFDIVSARETALTREVTDETNRQLVQLETRYAHIEDCIRASLVMLVNVNARWYLVVTGSDEQELSQLMSELDELINREAGLLEQTDRDMRPRLVTSDPD